MKVSTHLLRFEARRRRGSMLLEVMLALAIFIMAGTAILNIVGGTMDGMNRMKLSRQAADLARSAMAKIEAGIETPQTLNGPVKPWAAEDGDTNAAEPAQAGGAWELQIDTDQTQFRGLTKVTIKAVKHEGGNSDRLAAAYTLRQLVRLSGKGDDKVGEEDSLAAEAKRGLSAGGAGPAGPKETQP